jgi:hypothetical protein
MRGEVSHNAGAATRFNVHGVRQDVDMDQRISLITLGVADTRKARRFYEELGWVGESPDGDVVFFQAGGMVLRSGAGRNWRRTAA